MKKNELKRIPFSVGKKWFCLSLISIIFLSSYNLMISWQLQKIIDVAAGRDKTPLHFVAAISLFSFILFIIFYYVFRFAHPKFLQTASYSYKEFLFSKILCNNSDIIHKNGTGNIISKLTNDLSSIEEHYFDFYVNLIDIGVSFIGAIALMIWYSPLLTLIAIVLSILPILISIPASKQITKAEKHLSDHNAIFVEFLRDTLSGFSVIKSFNAEKELGQRFNDENKNIETAKFLRRFADENINLLSTAASVIMRIGVFLFGAWLSLSNTNITPGIVLVFLQLVTFVISPIEKVPSLLANRKASLSIIDKASDLIGEHCSNKSFVNIDTLNSGIEIKNLSFSYEPASQALNKLSLKFEAGKKYAIVGPSGSGKTTLFNLLSKYSDDYNGEILFDGIELRELSYSSILNIISIIHQNVFVFNDTIYNNITLYKKIPDEKFNSVIQQSGLSSFLGLHGKDYLCGANGINLSGGEKQRISIARALLRGTPILLMDEATSALDKKNSHEITSSVLKMSDVTALIITHRLEESLLKKYDGIFVLNHGHLAEFGTFNQLMENKGLLYSLIRVAQS